MTNPPSLHAATVQAETAITWKRLQQLFDDLIRALRARHSHARECVIGCDRCLDATTAARMARETYERALREHIG